jgi:hypothetical protein
MNNAVATPSVCYDKITFTFNKGNNPDLPPAYSVQYKAAPYLPGHTTSTESLNGVHAVLEVVMTPASASGSPAFANSSYKGNLRLALNGMRHTLIVELLDTFPQSPDPNAGLVVWLIGLDSKRPFTTDSANNPPHVNVLILN